MKGGRNSRSVSYVVGGQTYMATWSPFSWEVRHWVWQGPDVSWKLVGTADSLRAAKRLMAEHSMKTLRATAS